MVKTVVNWDNVKTDFIAGLSHNDIAVRHGVTLANLRKTILRKAWVTRKKDVEIKLSKLSHVQGVEVLAEGRAILEKGNAMLAKMVEDAQNAVSTLMREHADTGATDIEALEKRERTAGMLVKRIKETCGLDDVKPTGLVVIGQFTRFEEEPSTKAIDVVSDVSTDQPAKE